MTATRTATSFDEAVRLIGDRRTVCCIGVFDGVHAGHQKLVGAAIAEARRRRLASLVFTFRNHPLTYLAPPYAPLLLTEPDEKQRHLEALHPSIILMLEFNGDLARLEPEPFVTDVLAQRLRVVSIWCGQDFRFGRAGRGNIDLLRALEAQSGVAAHTIEPVLLDGHCVSSTGIRAQLEEGEAKRAAEGLGRPYVIAGAVVSGHGRGRLLRYPTANLAPPAGVVLPADGIYAVRVAVGGHWHGGMMNLGPSPTFGVTERRFEVHVLDFGGELVGQTVQVAFLERLRDIRYFDSVERLVAQIRADERRTRRILEGSTDE